MEDIQGMKAIDAILVTVVLVGGIALVYSVKDILARDEFRELPQGYDILRQCKSFENSNMIRCAGKEHGDRIAFICQDGYQTELSRFADLCQYRHESRASCGARQRILEGNC